MIAVIDGTLMLYRFRYVAEREGNASYQFITYLFMRGLITTLSQKNYTQVFVLWDDGIPKHRKESEIAYKGDREKDDSPAREAQNIAKSLIRRLLPYLGVISVGHVDAEADDLAFLLVNKLKHETGILISEDSDWKQCLICHSWQLYRPIKNSFFSRKDFEVEWSKVNPNLDPLEVFRYYSAILGTHNNIPRAVPKGIGPVKCIEILKAIFDGTDIPFISSKIEKNELGELIDPQTETRKLINRNYKLISMWWILLESTRFIEVVNDAIDHTSRCYRSPTEIFWRSFCGQLGSKDLLFDYDRYEKVSKNLQNWKKL